MGSVTDSAFEVGEGGNVPFRIGVESSDRGAVIPEDFGRRNASLKECRQLEAVRGQLVRVT